MFTEVFGKLLIDTALGFVVGHFNKRQATTIIYVQRQLLLIIAYSRYVDLVTALKVPNAPHLLEVFQYDDRVYKGMAIIVKPQSFQLLLLTKLLSLLKLMPPEPHS